MHDSDFRPSGPHFDEIDWAMLDLSGPPATETARARREARGARVADRARARYARRYYGRRWLRIRQLRMRRVALRRRAALVDVLSTVLLEARPADRAEARRLVEAAIERTLAR